jgi:GTPase SAR1 family protein
MQSVLMTHPYIPRHLVLQPDSDGVTPIDMALKSTSGIFVKLAAQHYPGFWVRLAGGDAHKCRALLSGGADPNGRESSTKTALHIAAELGHTEVVSVLLEAGASVDALLFGLSALHLAAKNGHADVCSILICAAPHLLDQKSAGKGVSPLHLAALFGREVVCDALLACGANLFSSTADGREAVDMAATREVVDVLIGHGVPVQRAVQSALASNAIDVVSLLLRKCHNDPHVFRAAFEATTSLDLSFRNLEALPLWIGRLPQLWNLRLEGNPLTLLPKAVLERDSVLDYLRALQETTEKMVWRGFKVMCLGEEGAGKTKIFNLLSGKKYEGNISTDGVECHRFSIDGGTPVNWYDFGGQSIFYATHQFFLSARCVYLLVFNMTNDNYAERLLFWLKVVHSFASSGGKSAPAVVVGTHLDEVEPERVESIRVEVDRIIAAFPGVIAKAFFSCTREEEVAVGMLERGIAMAVNVSQLGERKVPKFYGAVSEWVADQRERGTKKIEWSDVLATFEGLDEALLEPCFSFLHQVGDVFLVRGKFVVVDVPWVAHLYTSIFTFRHNWAKDGVVTLQSLRQIESNVSEIAVMMQVFESCDLCFSRREEGSWVFPALLPEHASPGTVAATQARVFRFKILPVGVFGRLMARVHAYDGVRIKTCWRYGVVLMGAGMTVALTATSSSIYVEAARRKQTVGSGRAVGVPLFQRVVEEIRAVCRSMFEPGSAEFEEVVACPHCLAFGLDCGDASKISYDVIATKLFAGEKTFACGTYDSLPLDLLGPDYAFDFVRKVDADEMAIETTRFARGAFGSVFKGVLLESNRPVVAKELTIPLGAKMATVFFEFQNEVLLMSQLRHENCVELIGITLTPSLLIVLEYCDGGDLLHALREGLLKTVALQKGICADVACGMAYLHSFKPPVAHRDLRSPNVLLMKKPEGLRAKIADFGMATIASGRLRDPLMTWQWMSPEAQAGVYDERCDLYSFGVVMWEVFQNTGETPFSEVIEMLKEDGVREVEARNRVRDARLRPQHSEATPKDVRDLIDRLWAHEPSERPSFSECSRHFASSYRSQFRAGWHAGLVRGHGGDAYARQHKVECETVREASSEGVVAVCRACFGDACTTGAAERTTVSRAWAWTAASCGAAEACTAATCCACERAQMEKCGAEAQTVLFW